MPHEKKITQVHCNLEDDLINLIDLRIFFFFHFYMQREMTFLGQTD